MKHLKGWKRPVFVAGVLTILLVFCVWMFGWGRGNIDVIDFSAEEVACVRLGCAQLYSKAAAEVSDPVGIQMLIDAINGFRHAGSDMKWLFKYGLFVGGSVLYEHAFELKNGDVVYVTFASNESQPMSDMELSYWVDWPDGTKTRGGLCRGSMEVFYTLHQKYLPY